MSDAQKVVILLSDRIEALEKNLHAITEICALAGIGERDQTVLCRVMDLHAALGHQIERAERAEAEVARLQTKAGCLLAAIGNHHAQRADDRCWMDDDVLYAAAGLPTVDRGVGDKFEMLKNCARFIDIRCYGGHWPTYRDLQEEVARLQRLNEGLADRVAKQSELLIKKAEAKTMPWECMTCARVCDLLADDYCPVCGNPLPEAAT